MCLELALPTFFGNHVAHCLHECIQCCLSEITRPSRIILH